MDFTEIPEFDQWMTTDEAIETLLYHVEHHDS